MVLSISKAWDESSAFLGREARLVAPVALACFALPAILADWAFPGGNPSGGAGWLMLLVLAAVLVGQMTIVLLVNGWRGSVGEAMGNAARRLPVLLAGLIIVFLPAALIATLAIGASLVSAGITDPAEVTPQMLAKLPNFVWVVMLLSIFFIVMGVRLFPVSAVAASERVGPITLLRRSWTLTRGSFWRLLALVLLLGVAALILDAAVTMVVGSVATIAAGEPRPFNTSALLVALVSGVVGALVSTVSAALVGRVYAQLAAPAASVPKT